MAICGLALWAFRDKKWPVPGSDLCDLEEMSDAADEWIGQGLTTFPHDTDINLVDFKEWADAIIDAAPEPTTEAPE